MTAKQILSDMRILYLEDEAIIALETAEMLRDLGFSDIEVAYSLKGVDKILDRGMPDIALLDVNLGHGRTSFDLGESLLEKGVPVVYATGYARNSLPADPRAEIIEKPLTEAMLKSALLAAASRERALPQPQEHPAQ